MSAPKPPPVEVDQVIAGKYKVERVLGSGGMGIVVAAHHIPLGRRVALKFLAREAVSDKDALNRFLREGQALARITGANVARVMDVGTLEHGEPYLVMEFLDGADLGAVLKQRETLPIEEAVGYVLQACEAVAEAHANGIVHRDLKPTNLFLTRAADGQALIKVLDFGISKSILPEGKDATVTNTGTLVGTPLYMSPEQIRDPRRVDGRTDIWSLGVILYELLCGATPFDGETSSGALAAIIADAHVPMRVLRKEVPPGLDEIISRCLKKDASARFATIAALAQALGPFAPEDAQATVGRISRMLGVGLTAPVPQQVVISKHPSHDPHSTTVPSWEGLTTLTSTKTRRRALGLALIAAIVAAFVGLLSRGGISAGSGTSSASPDVVTSPSVVASPPQPPPTPPPSAELAPSAAPPAELAGQAKPPQPAPSAQKVVPKPRPRGEPKKPPSKQETNDGTADRK